MMQTNSLASDFVRVLTALARGRNALGARAFAASAWGENALPVRVLSKYIDSGSFGDSPDYAAAGRAWIAFAQADSIVGRVNAIQPMRRTGFNTTTMRQITGATASWTPEGAQVVVSDASFDTMRLAPRKQSGLVVLTRETLLLTGDAFERALMADLSRACGELETVSFLDPAIAGDEARPASITHDAPSVASSGGDATAIQADVRSLFALYKGDLQRSLWLMNSSDAISLNMLGDEVGGLGLTANGGMWFGLPAICSSGAPLGQVTLLDPTGTLYADDGLEADLTEEALIDAKDQDGAAVPLTLWQSNLLAIKVNRYLSWQVAHAGSVVFLSGLNFDATTP
jgi:Phage capsid family